MPESQLLSPRRHYVDTPGPRHLDPRFWARCFDHHTRAKPDPVSAARAPPAPGPLAAHSRGRAAGPAPRSSFYPDRVPITPLDVARLPAFGVSRVFTEWGLDPYLFVGTVWVAGLYLL